MSDLKISVKTVCGVIKNKNNVIKYLGVSRKNNYKNFGFVGGKVENGETPIEAINRELREETGLEIKSIKLLDVMKYKDELIYCYKIETFGNLKTNIELIKEGEGIIDWVTKEQLCEGFFGEYNKYILNTYESELI